MFYQSLSLAGVLAPGSREVLVMEGGQAWREASHCWHCQGGKGGESAGMGQWYRLEPSVSLYNITVKQFYLSRVEYQQMIHIVNMFSFETDITSLYIYIGAYTRIVPVIGLHSFDSVITLFNTI